MRVILLSFILLSLNLQAKTTTNVVNGKISAKTNQTQKTLFSNCNQTGSLSPFIFVLNKKLGEDTCNANKWTEKKRLKSAKQEILMDIPDEIGRYKISTFYLVSRKCRNGEIIGEYKIESSNYIIIKEEDLIHSLD